MVLEISIGYRLVGLFGCIVLICKVEDLKSFGNLKSDVNIIVLFVICWRL